LVILTAASCKTVSGVGRSDSEGYQPGKPTGETKSLLGHSLWPDSWMQWLVL